MAASGLTLDLSLRNIDDDDSSTCWCDGFEPIPEPILAERVKARYDELSYRRRRWGRKHLPYRVQRRRLGPDGLEDAGNFIPTVWTNELVNREYEGDIQSLGSVVQIPGMPSVAAPTDDFGERLRTVGDKSDDARWERQSEEAFHAGFNPYTGEPFDDEPENGRQAA